MTIWSYQTKIGPFYIVEKGGRFHIVHDNMDLGSYFTPDQASEDLAGGHCYLPSSGIDPARLNIPEDLSFWEIVSR